LIEDMGDMSEEEAKARFKVGRSLYDAGRFAEAGAEWMKAYELSQRAELLYNVYVAYRDASDQPRAIDALDRYLKGSPQLDAETRLNLEARLRSMQEAAARGGVAPAPDVLTEEPAQSAAPAEQAAPVTPTATRSSTDAAPAERSIVPYVLLGAGGALVVGGAITGLIVLSEVSDLEDACPGDRCPDGASLDDRDSAKTLAIVTDVLLGVGVATAAVGAVLLLMQDDAAAERDEARAALGCGPTGCMASVRGHF
jgi:tetratricopeptide (TPR) repeat protein